MHAHMKLLLFSLLLFSLASAEGTTSSTDLSNIEDTVSGTPGSPGEIDAKIDEDLAKIGLTYDVCAAQSDLTSLLTPTVLALLVVSMGVALFYMVGKFLDSPPLIAIARSEILEIAHTILIVVFFVAFVAFAMDLLTGPDEIYKTSINYSVDIIHKITKDMFWLSVMNTLLHMLYAAPMRIGVLFHAIRFNLGGLLKPFVDGVGTMASLLSFALGEWIMNLNLLCFIKKFVPTFLLPIGIIFRSFPQTRGGGNALIGLSVALLFVYPSMLYLNYEAYKYEYGTVQYRSNIQELTSSFVGYSGLGATLIGFFLLRGLTGMLLGVPFLVGLITTIIDVYADVLYTVFVLSIFLPLLNIFITLTVARELAKYFGTEINISAFVKLI